MSLFPNIINIKMVSKDHHVPISNLVIKLRLYSKHKNDYYFIPPKSDMEGIIKIRKSWLTNEIEKKRNLFPMDFSSKLEDCESKMEVSILNLEEIKQYIMSRYQWNSFVNGSVEESENFSISSNSNYETLKETIYFSNQNVIDVEFALKELTTGC